MGVTLTENTIQWMFLSVVLLAGFFGAAMYSITKIIVTGDAGYARRRREREESRNIARFGE